MLEPTERPALHNASKKPPLFFIIFALLIVGALIRVFWPQSSETMKKPQQAVSVFVAKAITEDYPLRLDTVGRVQASENVTLKARMDGVVNEVLMREGREVKKDEVLIKLDDADLRIRLTQAEAALARSEAQLASARIELARNEELKEKNFISEDVLRTLQTNVTSLEATIKSDKAAVDNSLLQLSYAVIQAPFSGRVGEKLVFPGTLVKNNDTPLAVMFKVHPVQVIFAVPDRYLGLLHTLRTGGKMKVRLSSDADPELNSEGFADFIDNTVDSGSGTIQVKATFANNDDRLTPGAFVNVSIDLETLPSAIVIPAAALQQNGDKTTVYVVDAENKARLRQVKVRDIRNNKAMIAEGIVDGETVVINGQLRLTPDAAVQIQQEQ